MRASRGFSGATWLVACVSGAVAAQVGPGANPASPSPRTVLSLDGEWSYKKDPDRKGEPSRLYDPAAPRSNWGKMNIPVNWYKTEVGDYHGVIWFAREFEVPQNVKGREFFLRFNAVDYIAEAWLNGVYLGRHEGSFAPFEFRVTTHLRPGRNVVVVKVDSPRDPSEYAFMPDPPYYQRPVTGSYKTQRPVALNTIKGSLIDHWHRPGWQTGFSQDGNSGGIWQSVELIATGAVSIQNVRITPKLVRRDGKLDGTALLTVDMTVLNTTGNTVKTTIGLEAKGKNFSSAEQTRRSKEVVLAPGLNSLEMVQTVRQPVLWWSWDLGKPNLYQMRITAATGQVQDEVVKTFGIRELQLDDKSQWWLNGKRVFARGMRYHSSIWLAEMNRDRFLEDLRHMRELHINAIRIGSHVELPAFYDLCDEMGFLLWQVFPMHYGNYADTDELIERAAAMMSEMVTLLYNHAAIVMWSVFKEPNVFPFPGREKPNHYGRLCDVMRDAGRKVDPLRWIHKGDYLEGVQNVMSGWGEKDPYDFRKRVDPNRPQIVEYGTTHVAPLETALQILKPEERWPPQWNRWYYLNLDPNWVRSQGYDVTKLSGLEELVERSQSWAAREIKESIEYLRQRRFAPYTSMFLYFWSDPWPCLGGSGLLDYYRRKYKAYDIFGMVYSPVLVSIEWTKDPYIVGHEKLYRPGEPLETKIWVTNDRFEKYADARLAWQIAGPNGKVLQKGSLSRSVPEDSSQVVETLTWKVPGDAGGLHRMEVELRDSSGKELSRNYFEFRVTN